MNLYVKRSKGYFVTFPYEQGAESAEQSETPGHTYEGTPTTA